MSGFLPPWERGNLRSGKKDMTDVVIAGLGQTSVGEHWDTGLRELGYHAIDAAIKDAGDLRPQALFVGNMLAPNLSHQAHLGALLADFAGLVGIEAATIEAADASGAGAIRQGYLAIKSGMVDTALVVGVEKFRSARVWKRRWPQSPTPITKLYRA
jgi:acetyl-CoA C-acetyltransferase